MMLGFAGIFVLATFVVQLILSFSAKWRLVSLLPGLLLGFGELLCAAGYGVSVLLEQSGQGIYGAAFATVIYGFILLIALMADVLAWAIYVIVRLIQNKQNNL